MGEAVEKVTAGDLEANAPPLPPRELEMIRLRLDGLSLAAIGQQFGLSRERVRQLIQQHGGPTPAKVRARKAEQERQEQARRDAIVASSVRSVLAVTGAASVDEVARSTGLDVADVSRCWPEDLKHLRIFGSTANPTWSDAEILRALAEAATYEFPLTSTHYAELQRVGEIRGPSVALITKRFGAWSAACEAAGVEHGPTIRPHYQSRWTDDDLIAFAEQYFLDPDFPGSAHRYEDWRREKAPDAPSLPTLRNRLGGWAELKRRALKPQLGEGGGPHE